MTDAEWGNEVKELTLDEREEMMYLMAQIWREQLIFGGAYVETDNPKIADLIKKRLATDNIKIELAKERRKKNDTTGNV